MSPSRTLSFLCRIQERSKKSPLEQLSLTLSNPLGSMLIAYPNSEIAFQNMVKHKTAKSIKH